VRGGPLSSSGLTALGVLACFAWWTRRLGRQGAARR